MSTVLAALSRATLLGGGVPHLDRFTSALELDGGSEIAKSRVRSLRETLGFHWIPTTRMWKKDWEPLAKSRGWV